MLRRVLLIYALLMVSQLALPQAANQSQGRSNRQIIEFILGLQEKVILQAAEAMPAEKYSFAPTHGEFKGVRTFGQQVKHIAVDNYILGAGILGEAVPVDVGQGENGPASVQTKPQVLQYLKNSFAYFHKAAAAVDDANRPIATPSISPWPDGTATRMGVAVETLVHSWDHYGQLVEYLRMNGIVPPESRRGAVASPGGGRL
jgi:hypothetical protein